jgi:hypothetical protein
MEKKYKIVGLLVLVGILVGIFYRKSLGLTGSSSNSPTPSPTLATDAQNQPQKEQIPDGYLTKEERMKTFYKNYYTRSKLNQPREEYPLPVPPVPLSDEERNASYEERMNTFYKNYYTQSQLKQAQQLRETLERQESLNIRGRI